MGLCRNSIKESLYFSIPFLGLPKTSDYAPVFLYVTIMDFGTSRLPPAIRPLKYKYTSDMLTYYLDLFS